MRQRTVWLGILALALLGGGLWAALRPQPLEVDAVPASRARFERTVDDEGRTRVRDRYVLSAPVSGRLLRPLVKVGDSVTPGEPLFTLLPQDPTLIDRRTGAALAARADAARAALARAHAEAARARTAETLARSDAQRTAGLAGRGFISDAARESAELTLREREQARIAADHAESVASFELIAATAALQRAGGTRRGSPEEVWRIASPTTGQLLRLMHDSEQPVAAGAPLAEIGDINHLEVVVDVLSAEAAEVRPGQLARLSLARGEPPLEGRVRRVEPVANTRISALGIDEQRVPVLIDLPPTGQLMPGDGWRVDASIVVQSLTDVLVVPAGVLVRQRGRWQVFVIEGSVARARTVTLGGINARAAWIRDGVSAGENLVLHPPDALVDGGPVRLRRKPDAQ